MGSEMCIRDRPKVEDSKDEREAILSKLSPKDREFFTGLFKKLQDFTSGIACQICELDISL